MQGYDSALFSPPAPLARVALRDSESGATVLDVPMLLDTGADVTLVPKSAVDRLGVTHGSEEEYELMGFDGSRSFAQVVRLDLVFLKKTFKGRFLLVDQEWGLLGRDVLNHLSLLFDGPQLQWGEQRPVP
jgi:predicted aspartyl protease